MARASEAHEHIRRLERDLERERRDHERHAARLEREHAVDRLQLAHVMKLIADGEMLRPPAPIILGNPEDKRQIAHLESVLRDALDSGTVTAGPREAALAAFAGRYIAEYGYAGKTSALGLLTIAARAALATGLTDETAREEYEFQAETAREYRDYAVSAFGADGYEFTYVGYARVHTRFEVLLDGNVRGDIQFPSPATIGRGAEVITIGLHDLTGRLVACGPVPTLYLAFGQRTSTRVTVRL